MRRIEPRVDRLERICGSERFCPECQNQGWRVVAEAIGDAEPHTYYGTGCPRCGLVASTMMVIRREARPERAI